MTTCIQPQRGLGSLKPYVPGTPVEEVQREFGLQDVIKLASNENPLGASRRALAAHVGLAPEQVAVGNGEDGLIMQTCMAYLDEGDEAIVSRSSFPVYDIYVNVMRARLVKTPLRDFGLDLEAMAQAINSRTKLVFVCNPNNPTGSVVTAGEVAALMERVPDHVLVIFDEAYYELVDHALLENDPFPDSLGYLRQGRGNVLVMRSFSKAYGLAGIRLGYAFAPPEVLAPLNRVKEPFAVNRLAQAAGLAALEDEEFLRETVAVNHAGRSYLYREFERLGLRHLKSHTNFVLVELGPQALEVQECLLRRGVIVRPCTGYDLPHFVRVTVGDPAQNARLIETLETVLQP